MWPTLNQMWPRQSVSYLCQEYVSNEIAERIRDLMVVSIKLLSGLLRDSVIYSQVLCEINALSVVRPSE